jgi:hypothetical protein
MIVVTPNYASESILGGRQIALYLIDSERDENAQIFGVFLGGTNKEGTPVAAPKAVQTEHPLAITMDTQQEIFSEQQCCVFSRAILIDNDSRKITISAFAIEWCVETTF